MIRRSRLATAFALATLLIAGCRSDSATGPDAQLAAAAAGAPTQLATYVVSATRIDLGWQDNSPNETGFEIHRAVGTSVTFALVHTTDAGAIAWSDNPLSPHTQYCYKVRSVRTKGKLTYSAFSNTQCATTPGPPPAPASIDAVLIEYSTIRVTWSASTGATGYGVERSTAPAGPFTRVTNLLSPATSFLDGSRPPEEQACYRVLAQNAHGESASPVDCTTPPAWPTNLRTTTPPGGTIRLDWDDNSAVEDGYEIQRATSGSDFGTIATVGASVKTYADPSAGAEVRYQYRVRTHKDGVYSPFSNYAEAMITAAAPPAPEFVLSVPTSSTTALVWWLSISTNLLGFRLERSPTGTDPWVSVGTFGWYEDRTVDGGLRPEEQMCYRIFAFNSRGDSPPSPIDCTAAPRGPTDLVATPSADGAVDLTWKDASSIEDGYQVLALNCYEYYYGQRYCYGYDYAMLAAGSTSHRFANLPSGEWWFEVYALKMKGVNTGQSDPSNQALAIVPPW